MEWLKEHWFKIGILVALLLIAAAPAYYFIIYLPKKDAALQANIDRKQLDSVSQKEEQARLLQVCLDAADANYNSLFTEDCKLEGNANCDTKPKLSYSHMATLGNDRDSEKSFCFKQYPQS